MKTYLYTFFSLNTFKFLLNYSQLGLKYLITVFQLYNNRGPLYKYS